MSTIYTAIARNLRTFGYTDVTAKMVEEVDEARRAGRDLPHGIVGMFAADQLDEAQGSGS